MNAETAKRTLVDLGWGADQRRQMAEVLRFYAAHPEVEADLREFDSIRAAFQAPGEDAEPAGGWTAFEARLRATARPRGKPFVLRVHVLATAAAFLCGAVLTWFATAPGRFQGDAWTSSAAALSTSDIAAGLATFQQIDQVYDRRAGWVLLGDRNADMGVAAQVASDHGRVVMARLLVRRDGRPVSDVDLIIRPGQSADVTVPTADGVLMRYSVATNLTTPLLLSFHVELLRDSGRSETLAALATTLRVRPTETLDLGKIATTGGEYQIDAAFAEVDLTRPTP